MRNINKCPDCGSYSINTYRMMTGPIWCNECNYRVEDKEYCNPFLTQVEDEGSKPFTLEILKENK